MIPYWEIRRDDNVFDIIDETGAFCTCDNENKAILIAAAPELLEALKYVVSYHKKHDSGEGELFGLDYVTTCIAAIAKAEH